MWPEAMAPLSSTQTNGLSFSQETPLPTDILDITVNPQCWYKFEASTQRWRPMDPTSTSHVPGGTRQSDPNNLELVTWNIDAFATLAEERIAGIVSHLMSLDPAPDIIFLQEVPRRGLACLLDNSQIRQSYFSSEANLASWGDADSASREPWKPFATVTLLSQSRFDYGENIPGKATLGPVWRVAYPSRFLRDALCCDVFVESPSTRTAAEIAETAETAEAAEAAPLPSAPTSSSPPTKSRVRLINVHLDSLAINPSLRPRQLAIAAGMLRSADCGLIAGDFNPVLPDDDALVGDNGLEDAWTALRPGDKGYTWGVDGKQRFPPGRLDKIAMLGLRARQVEVMHPGVVARPGVEDSPEWDQEGGSGGELHWSDHSGLRCSFGLLGVTGATSLDMGVKTAAPAAQNEGPAASQ